MKMFGSLFCLFLRLGSASSLLLGGASSLLLGGASVLLLGSASGLLLGCASKRSSFEVMAERQSKANPSVHTYDSDGFYGLQPVSPERPVQNKEFFFKKCEMVSRDPRPSRADWECNSP